MPKFICWASDYQVFKLNWILNDFVATQLKYCYRDHAGGNEELAKQVPGIEVYGGDDRIDAMTKKVEHNTIFNIGNLMVQCLSTPCHTMGHVCYYVTTPDEGSDGVVFTGMFYFIMIKINCKD